MTDNEVLRTEENGIEFFTVIKTGECAVGERGLARMCGVSQSSIRNILDSSDTKNASKILESLAGQDFYLIHKITKKGGGIKAIKAAVAIEIIQHYAFGGREAAQATLKAFGVIGITSYIQSKTGWLPERFTAAPEGHGIINRILDNPDPWERLYHPALCRQAFAWFGANFYWRFCYQWMTSEERCKVDRLNPAIKGKRTYKIHQYLEAETRERLKPEIAKLALLLEATTNKQQFETLYRNLYGRGKQLDLLN